MLHFLVELTYAPLLARIIDVRSEANVATVFFFLENAFFATESMFKAMAPFVLLYTLLMAFAKSTLEMWNWVTKFSWFFLINFKIQIGGAYLGLVLEFNLPASAYATMALREITKMDMSAEFQTSLNKAGGTKQSVPAATGETAAAEEPEVKRIKLEPGANVDPDANQNSAAPVAAGESCENTGAVQIKLESGVQIKLEPGVQIKSEPGVQIKLEPGVTSDEKH